MKYIIVLIGVLMFSTSTKAISAESLHELSAVRIDGSEEKLSKYEGKVILVVNVASECGFTKQYKGLQEVYDKLEEKGLVIMGFPCNQFGGQEPGSNEEIQEFCSINYAVTFPMYEKIDVNGENTHPVYQFLKTNSNGFITSDIKWNFTKFLVDQNGKVVERYASKVKPSEIIEDIEKLL